MKTNHQPNHGLNTKTQIATQNNPQVKSRIKLRLDVDLRQITVPLQYDHHPPKPEIARLRSYWIIVPPNDGTQRRALKPCVAGKINSVTAATLGNGQRGVYVVRRKPGVPNSHYFFSGGHELCFITKIIQPLLNHEMKMFSGFVGSAGCPPRSGRILHVVLFCAAVTLGAGCSKKGESSTTPPQPPPTTNVSSSAPATQPPVANSQPGPAAGTTNAMPDLRPLNQALMAWIIQNRRHPATFEEFAASANIQIPPPPPGKKYIINSRGLISVVAR